MSLLLFVILNISSTIGKTWGREKERVSERKRVMQREARIETGKVGERKAYIYTKTGGERKRGVR